MAFILKLYNGDANYTIDFMLKTYLLADKGLEIPPAEKNELFTSPTIFAHGSDLISYSYNNRKISINFQVTGATRSTLLANVAKINKILMFAETNALLKNNVHTELQYAWDGVSAVSYFDIINGKLKWPNDVMSIEQVLQTDSDGNYIIYDFTLELLVKPFCSTVSFYNGTLTSLPLTNGNGTNVTTGLTIVNHDYSTAGQDNYVIINGTNIPGDAPCKAKITIKNTTSSYSLGPPIFISARRNNYTFNELDSAAADVILGTETADANASGGSTMVASTTSVTPVDLIRWSVALSTFNESAGGGGLYSLLAVGGLGASGTPFSSNASYRYKLAYSAAPSLVFYGDWVVGSGLTLNPVLNLGVAHMPPGFLRGETLGSDWVYVYIEVKSNTGASVTTRIDRLHLFPVSSEFRIISGGDQAGITNTNSIVDDPYTGNVYEISSSYKNDGDLFTLLKEVELIPGKDHTLFFLLSEMNYLKWATMTAQITVEIMPSFLGVAY